MYHLMLLIVSINMLIGVETEVRLGAKNAIEYRLFKIDNSNDYKISIKNRNAYDLMVEVNVIGGLGETGKDYSETVVIAKGSSCELLKKSVKYSRPDVELSGFIAGQIIKKSTQGYDLNGKLKDETTETFYPSDSLSLDQSVGEDVYTFVDRMNIGYDRDWIASHIVVGKVLDYGNGIAGTGKQKENYRILEVPARVINGLVPWVIYLELNENNKIISVFKKYQIK